MLHSCYLALYTTLGRASVFVTLRLTARQAWHDQHASVQLQLKQQLF
jgi:hypothetical protein